MSDAERAVERVAGLRRVRRYDEAERTALCALAGDPRHARLLLELSATLRSLHRPVDGLAAAEAAAAAEPENERAHRGHLHRAHEHRERAVRHAGDGAGIVVFVLVLVTGRGVVVVLNWPVVILAMLLGVVAKLARRNRR